VTTSPAPALIEQRATQTGRKVLYRKVWCVKCQRDTFHKIVSWASDHVDLKCQMCGTEREGIR